MPTHCCNALGSLGSHLSNKCADGIQNHSLAFGRACPLEQGLQPATSCCPLICDTLAQMTCQALNMQVHASAHARRFRI